MAAMETKEQYRGEVGHSALPARWDVMQVLGTVLGPIAVLLDLQIKYLLVQTWACKNVVASAVVLHLTSLVFLLVALGAGLLALREWRGAGREDPGDLGGREGRTRVNAAMGVGLSLMSAWIIVAMWLPHFFLSPCKQ
jgi:hypothetical protein